MATTDSCGASGLTQVLARESSDHKIGPGGKRSHLAHVGLKRDAREAGGQYLRSMWINFAEHRSLVAGR